MPNQEKLKLLQRLLQEEEESKPSCKKWNEDVEMMKIQSVIQRNLSKLGVIPPSSTSSDLLIRSPIWKSQITSSMYSLPTSTAMFTTLVPISSLTRKQREKCITRIGDDDGTALAEIPVSALMPSSISLSSPDKCTEVKDMNCPSSRPLTGNLSSKLTEYTRGQVGVRRPFRPGGMNDELENRNDKKSVPKAEYVPYCSPDEINSAFQVLERGSLASWKDGSILTSPPGATFDIGIGLGEDIMKGCDKYEKNQMLKSHEEEKHEMNRQENVEKPKTVGGIPNKVIVSMWNDKTFLDDDSLFGDDSSSSSDEEEGNDSSSTNSIPTGDQHDTRSNTDDVDDDEKENDIEDIDAFLDDINTAARSSRVDQALNTKKKISSQVTLQNALTRLKRKESTTHDRKCWAVTTQLNLKDFYSLVPNPAITYPFELDGFQKQAIARLERGECIFVAAHTSAGKTVVAEYAIALARKHCTRSIYTSPIKALSNQKYRDFKDRFGDDVGLITGDLQINPDSSCLIMTTEILRSMLYRGADLIRDIEWVIFDEVHYINDTERGVVWEEVIIMLPDYVNMIFLSATTPNTTEFSDWIGKTKRKPVHVIKTDYRPVPLSHYLYAGLKIHKVMEGKDGFIDKGWKEASLALMPASERMRVEQKGKKMPLSGAKQSAAPVRRVVGSANAAWQQSGTKQDWFSLVKFLEREMLMPTVVFCFSKKKCEEIAGMLRTLDLNTASERNAAHAFAVQTMKRLSPKDASLPQVLSVCEMVKRGVGIHHGGLLPILKEMVEILFSRNLIKVLLATETFAMGVNMPARAVVFNTIRKHDGTKFRVLEPGEYTQMAGRAGRRGLDLVGTVIICCFGEEPPPQLTLRSMLTGTSTKLQSQFRLTYNMILNLLRVEDMTVEGMIKRSFSEFATQRALVANDYPKLLKRGTKALEKLENEFKNSEGIRANVEDIVEYFQSSSELLSTNSEIISYMITCTGDSVGSIFTPGRIVLVTSACKKGFVRSPAIIVQSPVFNTSGGTTKKLVCIVLLPDHYKPKQEQDDATPEEFQLNYVGKSKNRFYTYSVIELNEILCFTSHKYRIDESKIFKGDRSLSKSSNVIENSFFFGAAKPISRKSLDFGFSSYEPLEANNVGPSEGLLIDKIITFLTEIETKEFQGGVEILPLKECMRGSNQGDDVLRFGDLCAQSFLTMSKLRTYKSHYDSALDQHYKVVEKKETLRATVETLRHLLSNESLQLFPDFLQRKSVLRALDYVDDNETVKVKGRVACECSTCEELVITEMIFQGILNDLDPPEVCAALSVLVFQEKSNSDLDSELPERLKETCKRMKRIAFDLGQLQQDHGVTIEPQNYVDSALNFGLVHVVYDWARGLPFSNICQLTTTQEGSIVRTIVRLDELCREVRNCARVVGNPTLYRKMEECSAAIKRDIVFASSLYVT